MSLPVLAHVYLDQGILVLKQELGHGLGELGFANATRAEEDEATDGTPRVLQPRARPANRVRDGSDCLILANNPLAQMLLHVQQARRLGLLQATDGDASPHSDDLGDVVFVYDFIKAMIPLPGSPFGGEFRPLLQTFAPELRGMLILAILASFLFLGSQAYQLKPKLLQVRGETVNGDAQPGPRLVNEVNRLVGQMPILHITVREPRGRDQGLIKKGHLVVLLVAILDPPEHLYRLFDAGLIYVNGGKTTLEGTVPFNALAILVQRRSTDAMQLAARQRWLHHVRRVDGSLCRSRSDHRVQLIDEKYDLPFGLLNFFESGFEALLKLAAEPRPRQHGAQIERYQPLVHQGLRHIPRYDLLREAFDDGRLANSRLANEHRVVLGAA